MQRSLNNNKIQHLHGPIQKLACIKKKKFKRQTTY